MQASLSSLVITVPQPQSIVGRRLIRAEIDSKKQTDRVKMQGQDYSPLLAEIFSRSAASNEQHRRLVPPDVRRLVEAPPSRKKVAGTMVGPFLVFTLMMSRPDQNQFAKPQRQQSAIIVGLRTRELQQQQQSATEWSCRCRAAHPLPCVGCSLLCLASGGVCSRPVGRWSL